MKTTAEDAANTGNVMSLYVCKVVTELTLYWKIETKRNVYESERERFKACAL